MKKTPGWRLGALAALAPALLLAQSQEGIAESVLKELKAATVYIKVTQEGDAWSGSGFLFRKNGDDGYIATNAHVADGDPKRVITVVFNSGQAGESQVPGAVMAIDYERDLAVLKVTGRSLPKPIDTRSRRPLKETLPVYTVGFPLGGALAVGAKNPEATFGKSSVSSLRRDPAGELTVVQLDGEVNPGNSGGPAVDESGDLVGIVYAKISRTQIAFAIPAAHLDDLVEGRATGLGGEITTVTAASAKVRVRADLSDPFRRIRTISAMWCPLDPSIRPRLVNEPYRQGMKDQPLRVEDDTAWGDLTFPSQGQEAATFVLQLRVIRGDGAAVWNLPELVLVDFTESRTAVDEVRMWQEARPVLQVVETKDRKARCSLQLDLLIPKKVRSALMLVKRVPLTPRLPKPGRSEVWARITGHVEERPLALSESRAVGEVEVAADPKGGPVTLILQGMIELEDRRKIYTSPVVQVVPFAREGVVKPLSRNDWIVTASTKNRDAGRTAGVTPNAEEVELASGPAAKVLDATVRTVSLAGKELAPRAYWSDDGRLLYLLDPGGIVRQVCIPEFRQKRRLSIGAPCGTFALTKEGLVVHVSGLGEIWVLDEATLEFKRKVTLAGVEHLAASRGSSFAYASAGVKLSVIDLKEGKVARQYVASDYSKQNYDKVKKAPGAAGPLWAWGRVDLAPDGATLLMTEQSTHRFRAIGTELVWDEIGPARPERNLEPVFSSDSRYFAVLEPLKGSREVHFRPAIYSIKDLSAPLVTLPTGQQRPHQRLSLAFDKEAGKIYCSEYGKHFVVYTPKGERAKQYEINPNAGADFLLAHPSGNKIFVMSPLACYWVELGN